MGGKTKGKATFAVLVQGRMTNDNTRSMTRCHHELMEISVLSACLFRPVSRNGLITQ